MRATGSDSGARRPTARLPPNPPAEPGVNYTATPANCIRCGYDLTPAELKKLKEETKHVRVAASPARCAGAAVGAAGRYPRALPPARQIVDLKKKLKEAEAKGKTSEEYTDARKTYDEAKAKAIKAHKKHHSRVKGTCSTADVPSLKVMLPVSAALPPGNATWGCLVNTTKDTDANSVTNWNHTGHVAVNGHTYATEFDSSRCGDKGTCKYCTGAKAVGKCKAHKKHPGVYKCAPLCGKKCQQARLEAKKAMAALK